MRITNTGVLQPGCMQRVTDPVFGAMIMQLRRAQKGSREIVLTPGSHGWGYLRPEILAQVHAARKDAATYYNCSVNNIEIRVILDSQKRATIHARRRESVRLAEGMAK